MTIPILILLAATLMMAVEMRRPGRTWPEVSGWWLRAWLFNGIQAAVVYGLGALLESWMLNHRSWSADELGPVVGGIVGYLVSTFVYYWWHRWRHEVDFLWRWFHQLHHSPQRIEVITSFYKHPFEILGNALLSGAVLYLLVGLSPQAASVTVLIAGVAELFYHWNVRTPYWLGYIIQRPESHCVHHQEGTHCCNYSDLPLWDMLFGTFHNPVDWNARCGFGQKGERRLVEMLAGIDITARPQTEAKGAAR